MALKTSLTWAWSKITEEEVRAVTASAIKRFKALIKAKGNFIEI